jgi:hypothetical protein
MCGIHYPCFIHALSILYPYTIYTPSIHHLYTIHTGRRVDADRKERGRRLGGALIKKLSRITGQPEISL